MNIKHKGFTLVELLVVIVILAILAAISIVSYGSIKDRAYNASVEAAASSALKIIQLAQINEGRIYIDEGESLSDANNALCIGNPDDFPTTSDFEAGECQTYGNILASAELWGTYSQYASGNLAVGEMYDGSYSRIRGIVYVWAQSVATGDHSDYLKYNLIGSGQECSLPGAVATSDDIVGWDEGSDETVCWINLDEQLGEPPLNW